MLQNLKMALRVHNVLASEPLVAHLRAMSASLTAIVVAVAASPAVMWCGCCAGLLWRGVAALRVHARPHRRDVPEAGALVVHVAEIAVGAMQHYRSTFREDVAGLRELLALCISAGKCVEACAAVGCGGPPPPADARDVVSAIKRIVVGVSGGAYDQLRAFCIAEGEDAGSRRGSEADSGDALEAVSGDSQPACMVISVSVPPEAGHVFDLVHLWDSLRGVELAESRCPGLCVGDVLVAINGDPVPYAAAGGKSPAQLTAAVLQRLPLDAACGVEVQREMSSAVQRSLRDAAANGAIRRPVAINVVVGSGHELLQACDDERERSFAAGLKCSVRVRLVGAPVEAAAETDQVRGLLTPSWGRAVLVLPLPALPLAECTLRAEVMVSGTATWSADFKVAVKGDAQFPLTLFEEAWCPLCKCAAEGGAEPTAPPSGVAARVGSLQLSASVVPVDGAESAPAGAAVGLPVAVGDALSVPRMIKLVVAVCDDINELHLSDTAKAFEGMFPLPQLHATAMWARLSKDFEKLQLALPVRPDSSPKYIFPLYQSMGRLFSMLKTCRVEGVRHHQLTAVFGQHLPGWIQEKRRWFLSKIVPKCFASDELAKVDRAGNSNGISNLMFILHELVKAYAVRAGCRCQWAS